MAIRRVVKVEVFLEDGDIKLINEHVHPCIMRIMDTHMNSIKNRDYEAVTCSLADVFDWTQIMAEINNGEIDTLTALKERVMNLDTAARYPFDEVLDIIEHNIRGEYHV